MHNKPTVKELTEVLSKFHPDSDVYIYGDIMQDVTIYVSPFNPVVISTIAIWNSVDGFKEIN